VADSYKLLSCTKDDLQILKKTCEWLLLLVGKRVAVQDMDFPNIWSALQHLGSQGVETNALAAIHEDLALLQQGMDQLTTLRNELHVIQRDISSIFEVLDKHDRRFTAISPLLQQIKVLQQSNKTLADRLPLSSLSSSSIAQCRRHL